MCRNAIIHGAPGMVAAIGGNSGISEMLSVRMLRQGVVILHARGFSFVLARMGRLIHAGTAVIDHGEGLANKSQTGKNSNDYVKSVQPHDWESRFVTML